jgi:SET domain
MNVVTITVDSTVALVRQKITNIQTMKRHLRTPSTRMAANHARTRAACLMQPVLFQVLLLAFLLPTTSSLSFSTNKRAVDRPILSAGCLAYSSVSDCDFVEIAPADGDKGLGAFATRLIKLGEYIGQYYGEILTLQEVNARYFGKAIPSTNDQRWCASRNARCQGMTGHYVFEMKSGDFVDAEDGDKSSWCRFMNHASEDTPECNVKAFDKLTIGGDLLVYPQFFAMRDIQKGEELCYFYGENSHCSP